MPRGEDEDIDGFMANLLQGHSAPQPEVKRKFGRSNVEIPRAQPGHSQVKRPRGSYKIKKGVKIALITPFVVALLAAGGFLLWRGPIGNLLLPPSPFTQEQKDKMGIPLYYPTKLPGSFKIETGSITQESGVMLYAITDDSGKRINVTLQKQPEGLKLEPLYSSLQDTKEIDTKFGKVKIGASGENVSIANILTGKTWVIVSSTQNTIDQGQLKDMIDSLKV